MIKDRTITVVMLDRFCFYFPTTYGVCKKRKYCNRMSEKKILSFDECSCFVCLSRQNKQNKSFVCLSVCLSGCLAVRGLLLWTQKPSKELADPNTIWWVSSMYEI